MSDTSAIPATPAAPRRGTGFSERLRVIGYQRFALGMVLALWLVMTVAQIREFLLIHPILSLTA